MPNPPDLEQFVRAVEDATTFPVLTEPVSSRTGSSSGGHTPAGTSSLGSMVRNTLHEVLSWRPSNTDAKGLKEALLHSFNAKELSGRTVYDHVPRSYIMQVQSDGGAVTGAQASIYARAKAAVDQSLPLLEGLYPLTPDSDREDLAAVRSTLRMAFLTLVEELGRVGGPRIQRVDTTFRQLLGDAIVAKPPAQFLVDEVGGQLGLLRDRLGLEIQRVNFSEEEKNLTNLHILADHAFTLLLSWNSVRHYFAWTGNDVFLGPQLVLLSRALRVVAESVHETYTALDSVFVGPAERQVILLRFENGQPPLTLADLLEWVDTFAANEGPQLILQAGKDGVISFRSTLNQLKGLVEEAVKITRKTTNNPTRGVHTLRVSTALEGVLLHLNTTHDLASPLSRLAQPEIEAIDPVTVQVGPAVPVRIDGENFEPDSQVELTRDSAPDETQTLDAERVHFASPTTLFALFDLEGMAGTTWTVVVRNPDGVESKLVNVLTIEGVAQLPVSPEIGVLTPAKGLPGSGVLAVEVNGRGFLADADVAFSGTDIDVVSTTLVSESLLRLVVAIHQDAAPGLRDLTVTNPDGRSVTQKNAFTIAKPLSLLVIQPSSGVRGTEVTITLSGGGLSEVTEVSFGDGITVNKFSAASDTALTVEISVDTEAKLGTRTVRISGPLEKAELANHFKVEETEPELSLKSIEPSGGPINSEFEVTLVGTGLKEVDKLRIGVEKAGIETSILETSDKKVKALVKIPVKIKTKGLHDVKVIKKNKDEAVLFGGFKVLK